MTALAIHPLTPDRWDDFVALFEPDSICKMCWCVHHRLPAAIRRETDPKSRKTAMAKIVKKGPPPGRDKLYDLWLKAERWVIADKASKRAPILSVTYPGLLSKPAETATSVLEFLGVGVSEELAARIKTAVDPSRDASYESSAEVPAEVQDMAKLYGLM